MTTGEATVEEAYLRYHPLVLRKCVRMLGGGGEAEEVAQETFVRLWRSGVDVREPRVATAWIYKTATRLAIDAMRSRARSRALDAHSPADEDRRTPENDLHWRRGLARFLELPEELVEVAILSRVDGLTQPEIAEVIGKSERSVRRLATRLDERLANWEGR